MWWRNCTVSILEFPTVWSLWILTFMMSSHMCPCLLSLQDLDLEAWSALGKIIRQEYITGKAVYFHWEAHDCTISLLWVSLPLIIMTQRHSLMRLHYGGIWVQRISSGGGFVPKGRLSMTRDKFGPHGWRDDAGTWWGEARYVAQHPVVPRNTAQQLSSPSVNTPKVEKPYPDLASIFFLAIKLLLQTLHFSSIKFVSTRLWPPGEGRGFLACWLWFCWGQWDARRPDVSKDWTVPFLCLCIFKM